METQPQEQQKEALQSPESVLERVKVLRGIVDEFKTRVEPAIDAHLSVAEIPFQQEKGYDDNLKREKVHALVDALALFQENVRRSYKENESSVEDRHLNVLFGQIGALKKALGVAPDARYDSKAQVEKFGGKENIPGGDSLKVWEATKELITTVRGQMNGIMMATEFLESAK